MGDDIDPVEFGKLIGTVEANTMAVMKLTDRLDVHITTTNSKLSDLEKQDVGRKGVIIGALGAGTVGGATIGEWLKHAVKAIFP